MDKNNNGGLENDGFDYDSLVEESLKNVVKKVLKITSETGLKGNSHFFISFNSFFISFKSFDLDCKISRYFFISKINCSKSF